MFLDEQRKIDLNGTWTCDLRIALTCRCSTNWARPNFMALFTMEFCAYILPRPIEIRTLLGAASTELCAKQRHEIGPSCTCTASPVLAVSLYFVSIFVRGPGALNHIALYIARDHSQVTTMGRGSKGIHRKGIRLFFCKYHAINHKGNLTGYILDKFLDEQNMFFYDIILRTQFRNWLNQVRALDLSK